MDESSGGSTTSGAPAPRAAGEPGVKRKPLYHHLYFWVLLAIVAGAVVGVVAPSFAVELKPLADGFVKLIRMLIAPIIFTTVVVGIASLGNLAEAGRLGLKALAYFITMTLIALAIGLVVINVIEPGVGLNITPDPADAEETLGSLQETPSGIVPFLLHIIPDTVRTAAEWRRLLRPGGRVVTATFLRGSGQPGPGKYRRFPVDHDPFDTMDALGETFAPLGFAVTRHIEWGDGDTAMLIAELRADS